MRNVMYHTITCIVAIDYYETNMTNHQDTCITLYTIQIFYKYIILKSGPAGVAHVTCQ